MRRYRGNGMCSRKVAGRASLSPGSRCWRAWCMSKLGRVNFDNRVFLRMHRWRVLWRVLWFELPTRMG